MIIPDIIGTQSQQFASEFYLLVVLKASDPCASQSEPTMCKTPKCTNAAW